MFRERLLPKPFHFVNTLGAAAGHYVGRNLGLRGQNLFLTQRGDAFLASLLVAAADLELGLVSQALVGAVEECTLPLDEYRQRLSLVPEVQLAEGTHWMLLQPAEQVGGAVTLEITRFSSDAELTPHLRARREIPWSFAHTAAAHRKQAWHAALSPAPLYAPDLPFHDSRDAALLTHWLTHRDTPALGFLSPLGRCGSVFIGAR